MNKRRSEPRKGGYEADQEDVDERDGTGENGDAASSGAGKKRVVVPHGKKRSTQPAIDLTAPKGI